VSDDQRTGVSQDALLRFVDAVLDLSDDPGPKTLDRYLAASRALEETRPARRRSKPRNRSVVVTEP
jgi:hypothetical protein